jgi:hypothetical protein
VRPRCPDPSCSQPADPEQDGSVTYWSCPTCGYTFGYASTPKNEDTCQVGIPEAVRAAAQPGRRTLPIRPI